PTLGAMGVVGGLGLLGVSPGVWGRWGLGLEGDGWGGMARDIVTSVLLLILMRLLATCYWLLVIPYFLPARAWRRARLAAMAACFSASLWPPAAGAPGAAGAAPGEAASAASARRASSSVCTATPARWRRSTIPP